MKRLALILFTFILLISCSTKRVANEVTSKKTNELVTKKRFSINCTMAYPMPTMALQAVANAGLIVPGSTVNQININGSQNQFKILGDSIAVYLPYYGEQRMAGMGYGRTNNGIQFEGVPDDSNFEGYDKKGNKVLNFTFKNDVEQCQAQVTIFPSGRSDIYINSSHRTAIRYSGNINALAAN